MTALATEPSARTAAGEVARQPGRLRAVAEHAAVGAVLAWWAVPLTRATGGRERHVVSIGVVLVVLALVATRPWARLGRRELLAAASLPVAALAVCLTSPIGWDGANDLGSWSFAVGVYVIARAYLQGRQRVLAGVAALALVGLMQFSDSWLAWWGGGDPSQPMLGTFYWHNPYAAFLLAPAVVGAALAVWPRRPVAVVGWVVAPLCSAGVLFSTSRATIALLVAGWVCVVAVAAWMPGRRGAMARTVLLAALTVVTAFALTGPPFFSHRAAPSSAVAQRSQVNAPGVEASYRTLTWRQGIDVYRDYPVAGTGFHGFASAAIKAAPGPQHSAYVHNAWLQAFSDGGTVLGLPFLLASLAVLAGITRRLFARLRRRRDPIGVVAGMACLLLAAHSLVDFDTSYPALFAALAFSAALAMASGSGEPEAGPTTAGVTVRGRVGALAVAVVVAVGLVAVVPAWHGALQLNMDVPGAAHIPGGAH